MQAGTLGWLQLLPQLSSMPEILHLPNQDECHPLKALGQIEDAQYIHVAASEVPSPVQAPVSYVQGSDPSQLVYRLPRLPLTFTLQGSLLESADLRGYHICCNGGLDSPELDDALTRPPPTLPYGLQQALVLYPDSVQAPLLVLVPEGHVQADQSKGTVSIAPPEGVGAAVRHHVYSVHPRTGLLSGRTAAARLYLAALFAACSHAVPLPGIGRTGADMALELLRQSFVNRPLQAGEAAHLRSVHSFSEHAPALRLKCAQLAQDSSAVEFLFRASPESDARPLLPWPDGAEARYMAEVHRAPAPYTNARKLPTEHECRRICGLPSFARPGLPTARVPTADWELAHDGLQQRAVLALLHKAADVGRDIVQLQGAEQRALPFSTQALRESKLGCELVDDLVGGLSALADTPVVHVDSDAVHRVAEELQGLAAEAAELVQLMGDAILLAFDAAPSGDAEHVLGAMRSAGLLATPARADLLLVTIKDGHAQVRSMLQVAHTSERECLLSYACCCVAVKQVLALWCSDNSVLCPTQRYTILRCLQHALPIHHVYIHLPTYLAMQALGPHLSESSLEAVIDDAKWWQILCILDDKLQRCVRCLPGAHLGEADARIERGLTKLAEELGNDMAPMVDDMHPRWLVFQVCATALRGLRTGVNDILNACLGVTTKGCIAINCSYAHGRCVRDVPCAAPLHCA